MALKFIDGKKIVYDDAEQDPTDSVWGGDVKRDYSLYTPGTQNASDGGNWDTPAPEAYLSRSNKYARKGTWSYLAYLSMNAKRYENLKWCRSEFMWLTGGQQTLENDYEYASISLLFDPSMQFGNIRYQCAYDCKENPDNLQTPFWLGVGPGGNFIVGGRFVGSDKVIGKIEKGKWFDFVLHKNGKVWKFYMNQKLVWEHNNVVLNGAPIPRLQHGPYKWAWNKSDWASEGNPTEADKSTIMIYMDEIRYGLKGGTATLQDFFIDAAVTPPVEPPIPPVEPPVPPTTGTITIAAGSTTDKHFSGGTAYAVGNKTERFGNFSYTIPVANGRYDVKLKFEEIYHDVAAARTFNVNLEGKQILTNYDIFTKAGGKDKVVIESFPVTVTDGSVSLQFITVKDNAKVTGIEVIPASVQPPVEPPVPVDPNIYYASSVESTETVTVNGVTKTVKSVVITWADGSKTEIYKK